MPKQPKAKKPRKPGTDIKKRRIRNQQIKLQDVFKRQRPKTRVQNMSPEQILQLMRRNAKNSRKKNPNIHINELVKRNSNHLLGQKFWENWQNARDKAKKKGEKLEIKEFIATWIKKHYPEYKF